MTHKWDYRLVPRLVLITYAYFTRDAYLWAKNLGECMTTEQAGLIGVIIAGAVWLMKEYHKGGIERRKLDVLKQE